MGIFARKHPSYHVQKYKEDVYIFNPVFERNQIRKNWKKIEEYLGHHLKRNTEIKNSDLIPLQYSEAGTTFIIKEYAKRHPIEVEYFEENNFGCLKRIKRNISPLSPNRI